MLVRNRFAALLASLAIAFGFAAQADTIAISCSALGKELALCKQGTEAWEYDDARSGDFAPLRFVPKGKTVVLGLVTTKLDRLETKDEIKRRIGLAAQSMPLEQMGLSPQCGFSSTVHGNAIAVDVQRAKLQLVVDTARDVWGDM
jgi:methionine synthase II (cobalamin-independent)